MSNASYRFSFGPWNIHEGADPFGPPVRNTVAFTGKLKMYKELGFDGVQLHDDDAVPDLGRLSNAEVLRKAAELKTLLGDHGLVAEFVGPRLWEDPRTIDGAYTSNNAAERQYAIDRARLSMDIAAAVGAGYIVLWLAREGTYIRESKNARVAHAQLLDALNLMLGHHPDMKILIEPKPNEPMDHAYIPTIGHALHLGSRSIAPERCGGLIETAHAVLAGLDPSDEMAYALAFDKLWSVHLNDQNGLKFDEDKSFGAANLRAAFNQVRVLEEYDYAGKGYWVGLDVKALRTTRPEHQTRHLANSKRFFEILVEKVRSFDKSAEAALIADRDYEGLEGLVLEHLMGARGGPAADHSRSS